MSAYTTSTPPRDHGGDPAPHLGGEVGADDADRHHGVAEVGADVEPQLRRGARGGLGRRPRRASVVELGEPVDLLQHRGVARRQVDGLGRDRSHREPSRPRRPRGA
ncbi:MAG: hypothetical protein V9E93_16725 [Steroidobacteraceae bacterium]